MRGSIVLAINAIGYGIITAFYAKVGPAWLAALAGTTCGWAAGLYYSTWLDDEPRNTP